MDLTQRQRAIFKALVEEFTRTAMPVGSKALIPLLDVPVSSATIRNEMAALEKEGLLEKTHTSSGRVPSQKGYRYYVEHLMELHFDQDLEKILRELFARRHGSIEEVTELCCTILSEMTHLTSIVVEPEHDRQTLKRFSLIPINDRQAVVIIITSSGTTEHRTFTFNQNISLTDLQDFTEILNNRLEGTPLGELAERMEAIRPELDAAVSRNEILFEAMMSACLGFVKKNEAKVYGRANMLMQPEFAKIPKLEELMRILENQSLFVKWTQRPENISVPIGRRNELIQIGDCSVVRANFETSPGEKGQLMVIGPNRMPYGTVIALMDYLSEQIENMFSGQQEGDQNEQ